jgi:hypothetical protein
VLLYVGCLGDRDRSNGHPALPPSRELKPPHRRDVVEPVQPGDRGGFSTRRSVPVNLEVSENHRLKSLLSVKPKECLEYIVAHEMVHLFEPKHNARFTSLLD